MKKYIQLTPLAFGLLTLAACQKCVVCSLPCVKCLVRDPNYGGALVATDTACGTASSNSAFEASIRAAYSGYDVNCTSMTGKSNNVCAKNSDLSTTEAVYVVAGYSCVPK